MKLPIACILVAALVPLASSYAAAPTASRARPPRPTPLVQIALDLRIPLFGRSFPIETCEFRCQKARDRCMATARSRDDERTCRLEYSLCSNDCDIYQGNR